MSPELILSDENCEDPLFDLVGLLDDPDLPDDIAEEHDHYFYGSPKAKKPLAPKAYGDLR